MDRLSTGVVELLLEAGVPKDLRDATGSTPAEVARASAVDPSRTRTAERIRRLLGA